VWGLETVLPQLRDVIRKHPGRCAVFLELWTANELKVTIRVNNNAGVRPSREFCRRSSLYWVRIVCRCWTDTYCFSRPARAGRPHQRPGTPVGAERRPPARTGRRNHPDQLI